jgi:hypothetical protein
VLALAAIAGGAVSVIGMTRELTALRGTDHDRLE